MQFPRLYRVGAFLLAFSCLPSLGKAAFISNTGVFLTDDQVFQLQFTVGSTSDIAIQSLEYGGGTNANSVVISSGGFATDVAVFSATGPQTLIDQDDTGGSAPGACSPRNIDGTTGLCLDGYLLIHNMLPGTYIVTLTEQGNPAQGPTLGDGFAQAGNGNFTGGPFIDPFGNQRNANWALDISGNGLVVSTTPEPGTMLTALLVIPALFFAARRRFRAPQNSHN